MSALVETLYSSFASAQSHGAGKRNIVYSEMQLLRVIAPRYDQERFVKEIMKIQRNVGIRVGVKHIRPRRKNQKLEKQEKENIDFLDYIFSDTIPFFHDFLTYGSPEAQYYQVKAEKKGDLDVFNKLCLRMIYGKELQCKLEVTDRRDIPMKAQLEDAIFGGPDSEPDFLDAIFTDDLSNCNPFLHNMLTTVY